MKRLLCILGLLAATASGFDMARPGYEYEFPRDHFSHPAFETEWWYYTGNVKTPQGRQFGFELTFFRYAIREQPAADSPWSIRDLYLAHFTLSDVEGQRFYKTDRLNRAGPGLAGAAADKARIWNGNWKVEWLEPTAPLGPQRLKAHAQEFSVELILTPGKAPVIQGINGVSRKAAGEGKASHYVSFTRLATAGSLTVDNETFEVEGLTWMDHEFSSDSLGEGQVGWDWMSIQLDDGTEFMLYRMRRSDGTADPYSSGTYIDVEGRAEHLAWSQIQMKPIAGSEWTSSTTGGAYPLKWEVEVPHLGLRLTCTTDLDDQEVVSKRRVGPSYWEGAMDFAGDRAGKPVSGVGYLEMTGYDKPLQIGPQDR